MFNFFEELFAPGRKHTRDEHNRLELTREDVGDADPGRGPIDLESGKVVVVRPTSDEADPTDPAADDPQEPETAGPAEPQAEEPTQPQGEEPSDPDEDAPTASGRAPGEH
ncbi:DUF6191 domain-containing protein [Streptomyces sp. NPDC059477]|uniref:DUF6191 domain-containing protein n=1 Tax=Streptomyces sp. NPDC059477 TaxID=3346847 RepID=UPI0036CDE30B